MMAPQWRETYQTVVRALAIMYGAPKPATLLARLDNFQRLNLLGRKPGKGHRHLYDFELISRLLVALEMSQLGFPPSHISGIFERDWPRIRQYVARAAAGRQVVIAITPSFMSGSWRDAPPRVSMYPDVAPGNRVCFFNVTYALEMFSRALAACEFGEGA
jgi:hypothetical protein